MMNMEKRSSQDVKTKDRTIYGYAAVFGQRTTIGDFSEEIAPGSFATSLSANIDILALVDHDMAKVLGRTKTGTLKLSEDAHGLRYEVSVPDTQIGRDLLVMAERGDLGGVSFGFFVGPQGEDWDGSHRTLKNVSIYEISLVSSWPAYSGTTVDVRAKKPLTATEMTLTLLELEGTHGLV